MGGRGSSSGVSAIPASNVSSWKGTTENDAFFGKVAKTSNKYMMFDQVKDSDNAIVMTNNIAVIKGNPVMITGKNTAVYLREGQYRLMEQKDGTQGFAVKISRERFKEYTFKSDFDFGGKKDTFDSLWKTAASQQRRKEQWKSGGRVVVAQNYWRKY